MRHKLDKVVAKSFQGQRHYLPTKWVEVDDVQVEAGVAAHLKHLLHLERRIIIIDLWLKVNKKFNEDVKQSKINIFIMTVTQKHINNKNKKMTFSLRYAPSVGQMEKFYFSPRSNSHKCELQLSSRNLE